MRKFLAVGVLGLGLTIGAAGQAEAISIDLDACKAGQDCSDLTGQIDTDLTLDGSDLVIDIANNVVNNQTGENSFITELGFQYSGDLTGLSIDAFTVGAGDVVATPTLTFDGKITNISVDFQFNFQTSNDPGRFETGESVQLVLSSTGDAIDLALFSGAAAHLQGVGVGAKNSLTLVSDNPDIVDIPDDLDIEDIPDDLDVEPEPATLLLFGAGMAIAGARLRRRGKK